MDEGQEVEVYSQRTGKWLPGLFVGEVNGRYRIQLDDDERVVRANYEDVALERVPPFTYGSGETRSRSSRDRNLPENLWLYALPNPHPDRELQALRLEPQAERSVIYGLTTTELTDHPLRFQPRRKLLLTLPDGVDFNAIGEIDEINIDLGWVISARRFWDCSSGW